MTSKPATVDSCFGLVGPHKHAALDTGRIHMQKMISLWTSLQTLNLMLTIISVNVKLITYKL